MQRVLSGRLARWLSMMLLLTAALALTAVTASGRTAGAHPAGAAHPGAAAHRAAAARPARAQQCADHYSAARDPSNPLALATPPGSDPLTGAHFFVDGPAHGAAAGAIAKLLGINVANLPDSESWASFEQQINTGSLHSKLAGNPGLAHQVTELEKVADQPEVQRVSYYSYGGGPSGVFKQTEKLLCHNQAADPGSIMLLNTYFLHPAAGACPSARTLLAAGPNFRGQVKAFAAAIARRPVVLMLETDSIGSTHCIRREGALPTWESFLRYEIGVLAALPHAVVYTEGGYEDSNTIAYTARVLNAIGVNRIRGFFTNDTHLNWTINEAHWATKVSRLTHGAHFIVNTAQNGNGPLLNPHPRTQGIENLCNPPGRGIGPQDTTSTGFPLADAWLWTSPPGNSSGPCHGGPPGGMFWPARAVSLAEQANARLGPGYPSQPY